MLYINENEKTYIRSLYYTANLNEQGSADSPRSFMTQNQYAGYTKQQNELTDKTINNLLTRYDITSYEGRHNLFDDAELVASFGGQGTLVSIFHGLFYLAEGMYLYAENQFNGVKSFFLGLLQFVFALPGLEALKTTPVFKVINTDYIKNAQKIDDLQQISATVAKYGDTFTNGVQKAMRYVETLENFIKARPNLNFLSKFLNDIKSSMGKILTWVSDIIGWLKTKTGSRVINVVKTKVDQITGGERDKNIEANYDMAANAVNQYANPTQYATQNNKNTQTATQDTTNPNLNYKSMPTTLKYK